MTTGVKIWELHVCLLMSTIYSPRKGTGWLGNSGGRETIVLSHFGHEYITYFKKMNKKLKGRDEGKTVRKNCRKGTLK